MAEPRDDKVSAAFRGLPPLEPPPALDDAIRAAARRAVSAKPVSSSRRWAIPASIAAVLALSIGVALHVEREKPLVVDGTPVPSGSAEYPVPQAPAEAPAKSQAPAEAPAKSQAPTAGPAAKDSRASIPDAPREETRAAFPVQPAQRTAPLAPPAPSASSAATANESAPRPTAKAAPIPAPAGASIPAPAPAPLPAPAAAPAPATAILPQPAAAPPAAPATADAARAPPAAISAAPMRAKREATGASVAKEAVAPTPDQRLERIVELRAAGRHAEADEALALFRRDYPEFVFTPEMWGKVKAR